MRPPAGLRMNGSAENTALRQPVTLIVRMLLNSATDVSSNSRGELMPAEHTTTSIRPPCAAAAAATAVCVPRSSATSAAWMVTLCASVGRAANSSSRAPAFKWSRRGRGGRARPPSRNMRGFECALTLAM